MEFNRTSPKQTEFKPVTPAHRELLVSLRKRVEMGYTNYVGQEGKGGARQFQREMLRVIDSWLKEGWYPVYEEETVVTAHVYPFSDIRKEPDKP